MSNFWKKISGAIRNNKKSLNNVKVEKKVCKVISVKILFKIKQKLVRHLVVTYQIWAIKFRNNKLTLFDNIKKLHPVYSTEIIKCKLNYFLEFVKSISRWDFVMICKQGKWTKEFFWKNLHRILLECIKETTCENWTLSLIINNFHQSYHTYYNMEIYSIAQYLDSNLTKGDI